MPRSCRNRPGIPKAEQPGERRFHDVVRVGGAHLFRENVFHPGRLEQCTDAASGDQPCSGRCRLQENFPRSKLSDHFVGNRSVDDRNRNNIFLRVINSLGDRIGHFVRFAEADADMAVAVARQRRSR